MSSLMDKTPCESVVHYFFFPQFFSIHVLSNNKDMNILTYKGFYTNMTI